jgi:hypothetical protein
MPLVLISLMKREKIEFGGKIGEIVHQEMVQTIVCKQCGPEDIKREPLQR